MRKAGLCGRFGLVPSFPLEDFVCDRDEERQLRPVSYYFKKGSESKYMRFGFIGQRQQRQQRRAESRAEVWAVSVPTCSADDLESVLPQVVRTTRPALKAQCLLIVSD